MLLLKMCILVILSTVIIAGNLVYRFACECEVTPPDGPIDVASPSGHLMLGTLGLILIISSMIKRK
tara:strand:- start:8792 stop:8989 length:198 start_codon:yes stop_codon:yes gene_type:complete